MIEELQRELLDIKKENEKLKKMNKIADGMLKEEKSKFTKLVNDSNQLKKKLIDEYNIYENNINDK